MADALPVALLARAGAARDQLQHALSELGAHLVLVADPNDVSPGDIPGSGARAVLVAVEPAIERALERLEPDLWLPGVNVLFDEAELGQTRKGWDEARWARHLAAKLLGSDVLPAAALVPSALPDAGALLQPGAPTPPAALAVHPPMDQLAAEGDAASGAIPSGFSVTPESDDSPDKGLLLDAALVDDQELVKALAAIRSADVAPLQRLPVTTPDIEVLEVQPLSADDLAAFSDIESHSLGSIDRSAKEVGLDPFSFKPKETESEVVPVKASGLLDDFDFDPEAKVDFSSLQVDESADHLALDEELAAFASRLDDMAASVPEPVREPAALVDPIDLEGFPEPELASTPGAAKPALTMAPSATRPDFDIADDRPQPKIDFSNLSLVDDAASMTPPPQAQKKSPPRDFSALASGLKLEGEELPPAPPPRAPGLVLVLAGMGGPDPVRKLLRGLPPSLAVPVVLMQHLDGGRHERLAEQLGKVCSLNVSVPGPHTLLAGAQVFVVPESLGVDMSRGMFHPGGSPSSLIGEVPAADLLVVALSGADPVVVPALKLARNRGAQVYVQALEGCFEPSVAKAMAAEGAQALAPERIAEAIAQRFIP